MVGAEAAVRAAVRRCCLPYRLTHPNLTARCLKVLDEYVKYADSMLGRWDVKADGHQVPNVRALTKPLLGLFHGEPRSKQWRAAVDEALRSARSVREVLDATLHVLSEETLDAPPAPTPADAVQLGPAMAAELPPPMGVEPRSARGGCSLA